jgi:transposase InsO family protein
MDQPDIELHGETGRIHDRDLIAAGAGPTAEWLGRQITEAFPWTSAPAYLVRDNDRAYGDVLKSRVRAMGIRDRPISPGSPGQNAYVERLIGTVRRECLDRMLVFGVAPAANSFCLCSVLQ